MPAVDAGLRRAGLAVQLRADGDRIFVNYTPLFAGSGFVKPEVLVEFGARSSGEPREARVIECDAAAEISEVAFPSVRVFVMLAERTFWGEGDGRTRLLPPAATAERASLPALARPRAVG